METQTIVVPETKQETTLRSGIVYQVPPNVWVLDAETREIIHETQITVAQAMKVLLVPKIAGG